MGKILLVVVLFFINIFSVFAAAGFSDPLPKYYLFFQNNLTKEVKYIKYNDFIFDYYFTQYIEGSEIGGKINIDNWKVIRLEKTVLDIDTGNEYLTIYNSGVISSWDFGISVKYNDNGENHDIEKKSDISQYKKLNFSDLNYKENIFLFIKIFFSFFNIWFLILLPLNIVVFFCFGYWLLLLYEKYNLKIFQNVYVNSFIIYFIFYIGIIFFGFSIQELSAQNHGGFMTYFFVVGFWKFILFLISKYVVDSLYNKKYENKINYSYVFLFYVFLFIGYITYVKLVDIL